MGEVKPFPSSSVGLAEIKHSFTAQSNPPCPASASPSHLLEEVLKAVALLKCQALHAMLSERSPQLTLPTARFLSTMPAGALSCPYNQPSRVAPSPAISGDHRGLSGAGWLWGLHVGWLWGWGGSCKALSVSGPEQQRGLFEGKKLLVGRCSSHAALQLSASYPSQVV